MDAAAMLAAALDISGPWHIESVGFAPRQERKDHRGKLKREAAAEKRPSDPGNALQHVLSGNGSNKELHITIIFHKGAEFPYPAVSFPADCWLPKD